MADTVHTAAYNSTEMSIACTLAISTLISKGFTIKSSPPILIAITMFILSDIDDINITGTFDIFLICIHQ